MLESSRAVQGHRRQPERQSQAPFVSLIVITYIALELCPLPRQVLPEPALLARGLIAHKVVHMLLEEGRKILAVEIVEQFGEK